MQIHPNDLMWTLGENQLFWSEDAASPPVVFRHRGVLQISHGCMSSWSRLVELARYRHGLSMSCLASWLSSIHGTGNYSVYGSSFSQMYRVVSKSCSISDTPVGVLTTTLGCRGKYEFLTAKPKSLSAEMFYCNGKSSVKKGTLSHSPHSPHIHDLTD